jgi:hypothetical protein
VGTPNDALAGGDEVALQAPGQMPAVLDRPSSLRPISGPAQRGEVPVRRCRQRRAGDLAAELVGHDEGVRLLVGVDTNDNFHNNLPAPITLNVPQRRSGRTCLSRETDQAPIKSRPAASAAPWRAA